mgnify:CR=1 FL=1
MPYNRSNYRIRQGELTANIIQASHIVDGAVSTSALAANIIQATHIVDDAIGISALNADILQASHVAAAVLFTGIASQLVQFRVTIQHDSATGNVVTFSLNGYGAPAFIQARYASNPIITFADLNTSVTANSSLVYMTLKGITASAGSLANTISQPYTMLALIASR